MLAKDILRAFIDHAIAHNIDPFSQKSNDTYNKMYELLERDYWDCEHCLEKIINTLCIINEDGRISLKDNFKKLIIVMTVVEKELDNIRTEFLAEGEKEAIERIKEMIACI